MIVRDYDGKIHIVLRNTCKNDSVYYEKLYTLRLLYDQKYKNVVIHIPKSNIISSKNTVKDINKDLLDD